MNHNTNLYLAFAFVIYFSLFTPIAFANPAPTYSNNITDPDSPTFFVPGTTYQFNITWIGANTVLFENNFSGAFTNVTVPNDVSTYYNRTIGLAPGIYQFRWIANDSSNEINSTPNQTYIVNKSLTITRLYLNGSEGDESNFVSYSTNALANITIVLKSAINPILNPSFDNVRTDNTSLPKNWFYDRDFDGSNLTATDRGTWNLSHFNLTNLSLFMNIEAVNKVMCANPFPVPSVKSKSFSLDPNTRYELQFDVKANVTANITTFCGETFVSDFIDVFLYEYPSITVTGLRVTNATSIAGSGTNQLTLEYPSPLNPYFSNPRLDSIANNIYRFTGEVTTKSDTNTGQIFIAMDNGMFFLGSYATFDNIVLMKENASLSKTVRLSTNTTNVSLNASGTSAFTLFTPMSNGGTFNFTGFFNDTSDANYSTSSDYHFVFVGSPSNLTVSTDSATYNQSDNSAKFFAAITANYTNITGSFISGATCKLTTNNTDQEFTMNFVSATKIYNYSLDTEELHGDVLLKVRCSGNSSFIPQNNSNTTRVWFRSYFKESPSNFSVASGTLNTTSFTNKTPSSTSTFYIFNKTINTTTSTTGDAISFWFIGNETSPQNAFGRDFLFRSNATIKGNISISNLSLLVYPCLQTTDSSGTIVQEVCGNQNTTSSVNSYQILEYNFSVSDIQMGRTGYLRVTWKYNWTNSSLSNPQFNISYNSSLDSPALTIYDAEPLDIKSTEFSPEQLNTGLSIGPNTIMNVSLRTTVNFNNTRSIVLSTPHSYNPPFSNAEVYNVQVKSSTDTVLSSTLKEINQAAHGTARSGFSVGDHYHLVNWTTESIFSTSNRNETVDFACECLHDIDQINTSDGDFQLLGNISWHVYLHKHLFAGHNVTSITPYTSYSAYGAFSGWTFRVNLTNSSGTYDISSGVVVNSNGTLTFPKVNLIDMQISYRIHAIGKSVGESCTSNNECSTGLCFNGGCALSGTTSVGGGVIKPTDILLEVPKAISLLLGQTKVFIVNVTNVNRDVALNDVALTVSGYIPALININSTSVNDLAFNQTKQFTITLKSPNFLTGAYFLRFLATAKVGNSNISATANTNLTVTPVTRNDAQQLISEAESSLDEMTRAGFKVERISDLLERAKTAFEDGDYSLAASLALSVIDTKDKAFAVSSLLRELKGRLDFASFQGLDTTLTTALYELALLSFENENYVRAEELLREAFLTYSIETLGKINLARFISNNWFYIILFSIMLWYGGGFGYRKFEVYWIDKRLTSLIAQESIIERLKMEVEHDYFRAKKVSRDVYYRYMYQYEKKLSDIRKIRSYLVSRRALLGSLSNKIRQLDSEDRKIVDKIKDLQKQYFIDRSISKSVYDSRLRSYRTARIDLREEIEVLKSKSAEKKESKLQKIIGKFLILLIVFSIFPSVVFAQVTRDQTSTALLLAENDLQLMINSGFNITSLTPLFEDAKAFFDEGSYEQAYDLASQLSSIKQNAFSIYDNFEQIDKFVVLLVAKKINIEEQISAYELSKTAFYSEDYSTADALSSKVLNELEDLQSGVLLNETLAISRPFDIVDFVRANIVSILVSVALLGSSGFILYQKFYHLKLNKRLEYLGRLESSIRNLLKDAQQKYFSEKSINKGEYELRLEEYNQKLADIKREINIIFSKLKK